ncbi:hypothetical protein [Natronobiforma cellulositropha]|uniref:hypothetical protein n=1 Tax=Natronobiforma cellulositropha TaxID=1679076 RepID=UPI0021D5E8E7|nr:hypothetical protein [Natronobiforma cellulositropha]
MDIDPGGDIVVFVPVANPDDATVVDATEAPLSDLPYFQRALSRASDEYEEGMEADFDADEHRSSRAALVRDGISPSEVDALVEALERDRAYRALEWYVAYENTTYPVSVRDIAP